MKGSFFEKRGSEELTVFVFLVEDNSLSNVRVVVRMHTTRKRYVLPGSTEKTIVVPDVTPSQFYEENIYIDSE